MAYLAIAETPSRPCSRPALLNILHAHYSKLLESIFQTKRNRTKTLPILLLTKFLAAPVLRIGYFPARPLLGNTGGYIADKIFFGDAMTIGEGISVEENIVRDNACIYCDKSMDATTG